MARGDGDADAGSGGRGGALVNLVLYSASPAKNDSTHTNQCRDKGYSWSGGSSVLVTLLRIKIDPINMEEQILQLSRNRYDIREGSSKYCCLINF